MADVVRLSFNSLRFSSSVLSSSSSSSSSFNSLQQGLPPNHNSCKRISSTTTGIVARFASKPTKQFDSFKLCKTAAEHPEILFLKVNFDENKPMCKNLNVKVLPYFHFYRGADGQLDSFSCSLAKEHNNMKLELLMNVFGGLGAGGLNLPNTPDVPPGELYATQLSQLQEMGFFDTQENIRALRATSGNVHAVVERLLGNPGT